MTQTRASWIFGSCLVSFVVGVFVLGPPTLPDYKQRILAYLCALLAGLFAIFFTGSLLLRAHLPMAGKWVAQGGAGFALFLIVLFWWFSPLAPVKSAGGDQGGTHPTPVNPSSPFPTPVPVTLLCVRPEGAKLVPFSDTILTVKTVDGRIIKQEVQPKNGSALVYLVPGSYTLSWLGSGNTALEFDVSAPQTTITVRASTAGNLQSLSVLRDPRRLNNSPADVAAASKSRSTNQIRDSLEQPDKLGVEPNGQSAAQSAPSPQSGGPSSPSIVPSVPLEPATSRLNAEPLRLTAEPAPQASAPGNESDAPVLPAAAASSQTSAVPHVLPSGKGKPPSPCSNLTTFKLAVGEANLIVVGESKYYIFLKKVDVHVSGKDTAKIYVIASATIQWDTKKVRKEIFDSTIKSLLKVPGPAINNDSYGVFDLDDTSNKPIQTQSGPTLWITVKPHYVLSRADFKVCHD